MSDKNHILFTTISFFVIIVCLILANIFIHKDNHKKLVLKISAILTVIIHFSSLYVDFFAGREPSVEDSMLLPLYPCNVAMWTLVILAFMKRTETKLYNYLCVVTFYLGVIGGILGIVINEIYINNPNLAEWGVLKGLLSHSTMLFGCIYIVTAGFLKPRVSNLFYVFFGLILLIVDGGLMIFLHWIFKLELPNSMYLLERPFEAIPWLNVVTIGILAMVIIFIATALYEQLALKKEDRWYTKLKAFIESKKSK
ncbi:MAG: YwaF family protein [Clostridia bacterium]|nr:YwaF family protein [Clostridia bacterium]